MVPFCHAAPHKLSKHGLCVFLEKLTGFCAVSKNSLDGGVVQQAWDVGRDDITDAAVGGAKNLAALDYVPDGNLAAEQKLFFLWDAAGDRFPGDGCQDFPKSVLGMPIIKSPLPGLDGGEGAKDQDFRFLVVNRFKFVCELLVICHGVHPF